MDDRQLKNLLDGDMPPADENARKRALNLALAEFQVAKKEPKKLFQGFSPLSRLTDRSNEKPRRAKMNKKLVYGGMATAMVALLAVGATVTQMNERNIIKPSESHMLKTINPGDKISKFSYAVVEPGSNPVIQVIEKPDGRKITTYHDFTSIETPAPQQMAMVDKSLTPDSARTKSSLEATGKIVIQPVPVLEAKKDSGVTGEIAQNAAAPARAKEELAAEIARPGSIPTQNFNQIVASPVPMEADAISQSSYHDVGRDKFQTFDESPVKAVREMPVSTFSIDVDTSSYAFMRKQLNQGVLPQKDSVRVEEMVNYFDYKYALPDSKAEPFKPTVTIVPSPWVEGHKLVHIAIKGYDIPAAEKPHSNLVFLIDTSGSMNEPDKLPLLKNSFKMLLDTLKADDSVAIVTYAGSAGVALEPTKVSDKAKIIAALEALGAGGGTAGAEGIRAAYQLAEANLDKNGVNRVILATDGDFNIGITSPDELKGFIERERQSGIFLSVLGFGTGNYNDQMMQDLAQNGNGVAAYVDTLSEARKVLVQESSSTLFTIAKDVKIQVEFNPAKVAEYRLVGYETRALAKEDFNNDKVDAGDIGSGHAVTAIYDITPAGETKSVDDSRYTAAQREPAATPAAKDCHEVRVHATDDKNSPLMAKTICGTDFGGEYGFLKIRYKLPDGDTSKLVTTPIVNVETPIMPCQRGLNSDCTNLYAGQLSDDVRFSVAVAGFGQLLKGSKYTGKLTYDDVITEAQAAKGNDEFGYRAEFINLVRLAKSAQGLPDNQQ